MTEEEQMNLWLDGRSVHNHDKTRNVLDDDGNVLRKEKVKGGECCPDFSCCMPDLKWSDSKRREYVRHVATHNDKAKSKMLGEGFAAMLKATSRGHHSTPLETSGF